MNTLQIAKDFEKFTKRGQILSNLVALAVTQKRTKKPGCETCVEVTILPSTPQNKFRESLKSSGETKILPQKLSAKVNKNLSKI